jgi:hypothetical protein
MRLPDFTFPSDTVPAILAKAAQYNQWIEQVSAENFIKIGTPGGGQPQTLPGILDRIEVSDAILTDDVRMNDKSGSVKIISGWADSDLSITLLLIDIPKYTADRFTPDITRYDCLKEINSYFKTIKDGAPGAVTLQHPHLAARGLREFIFSSLKSSESREKRIVTCTLEFDEFDSATGKSQDRQLGVKAAAQTKTVTSVNPVIGDDQRAGLGKLEKVYAGS